MVVEVDGSILEGGGQILRLSFALSAIRQLPIRIQKIRAHRVKGGLAPQHLTGIRLVNSLCEGKLENDALGSCDVTFTPGSIHGGEFLADTKTGGSVALLLQVALPCVLFGNDRVHLTLKGGTNADFAPQIDYVTNVLQPVLQKFGVNFEVCVIRRGFIKGQGAVKVTAAPIRILSPVQMLDFGEIDSIQGEAFVAGCLPLRMADEMAKAAKSILRASIRSDIFVKSVKYNEKEAFGNGSGINLVAKTTTGCYLGSSYLGKSGIPTEEVGTKAGEMLLECIRKQYCVDHKMQDQLIIYMALASGKSKIKVGPITSHTETAIYIAELLTKAKFTIIKVDDDTNIIECDGIGQENNNLG